MAVIDWVDSTGSTNADLAAAVAAGRAQVGDALVAREQTAGRGRLGRAWSTPRGASLAVSVVVEPRGGWLPLVTGLAVAEALAGFSDARFDLKWPNDVLVEEQKIAGILGELVPGPAGALAVVGIGLNTAMTAGEAPVATATSLAMLGVDVAAIGEEALAGAVVARVRERTAGPAPADAYRERCVTLGREIRLLRGADPEVVGTAVDVDDDARLVVRTADGEQAFAAGDVEHVRRA